jgi:hypothetical protein
LGLAGFARGAANLPGGMTSTPTTHRTGVTARKLRSGAALVGLIGATVAIMPAAADAAVSVSAYRVPTSLVGVPAQGGTVAEPAIQPAPDGSDAEWVVVSGQGQNVISITPTGHQTKVTHGLDADSGIPDSYASVDADGYDWILDNDQGQPENILYAVGAVGSLNPGLNPVASFNGFAEDMTLGADGALYISDDSGSIIRCQITATPSAVCGSTGLAGSFDGGAYAIGNVGGSIWFTDAAGNIGAYTYPSAFGGPLGDANDLDPGTIVAAPNGMVYLAGGAAYAGGANTEIMAYSTGGVYQGAISNLGNVVSMTLGPDGNLWFLDAAAGGSVAELDLGTAAVTRYPLPAGTYMSSAGPWKIASGPDSPSASGTGEVFFSASTANDGTGNAEIGEVSGIPLAVVPGTLGVSPAVKVSKRRVATMTLACNGASNSQCTGSLTVSISARLRVRVRVRAARQGASERYRTITQIRRMPLGTVSYSVHGGKSVRATVKLSATAYRLLEKVVGHRWNATLTSAATFGTVTGSAITMTGPTPKVTRPKRK